MTLACNDRKGLYGELYIEGRTDQDRRSANMARRREEKISHASDVVHRSHPGGMRVWESLAAFAQVAVTELAGVSYAVRPSGEQTRVEGRTDVESNGCQRWKLQEAQVGGM